MLCFVVRERVVNLITLAQIEKKVLHIPLRK